MKIDYKKHYGKDGTVYTQTITISKDTMRTWNDIVDDLKAQYDEEDNNVKLYLQKLNGNINYCTLTTLKWFKKYCGRNNARIKKDRNTIIVVEY